MFYGSFFTCCLVFPKLAVFSFISTIPFYLIFNISHHDLIFFLKSREILQKMQINEYYRLGKDTKEFVSYLRDNLQYPENEKFKKSFIEMEFRNDDIIFEYKKTFLIKQDYYKEIVENDKNRFK